MTVSCSFRRSGRSPSQSNASSTTTEFGMCGALSRSLRCRSSPPSGYGKTAGSQSMSPVIARAYGIDQQLGRIAAVSLRRVPRAVHAEAVALPGADAAAGSRASRTLSARAGRRASRGRPRRTGTVRRGCATSEKIEKLVPRPFQVAPSGNGSPGCACGAARRRSVGCVAIGPLRALPDGGGGNDVLIVGCPLTRGASASGHQESWNRPACIARIRARRVRVSEPQPRAMHPLKRGARADRMPALAAVSFAT